jgi:sialic acid synthase SpsE
MRIANLDSDERVVLVAEIGNNHEGSLTRAEEMLRAAADAGADVVKFQTFRTELFHNPQDTQRYARLRTFQLSFSEFERLAALAASLHVVFMSTPLDLESAAFLAPLVPAFKIGSGENTFYPLLERVAGFGKPVLLSCGLASLDEIRYSRAWLEHAAAAAGVSCEVGLLHCVSSYPAPPEQVNLRAISLLERTFDCTVGYSDHTLGIEASVAAVAAGARIIEKHFTLDKHFSDFRDHALSADPEDLRHLVERIRMTERLLGSPNKSRRPCEESLAPQMRRSITARRALSTGEVITFDDLMWTRPSGGLPPGAEAQLLGRRTRRALLAGEMITPEDVTDARQPETVAVT